MWTAAPDTLNAAHDITERLFVVRRAFRVNDNLPSDTASAPPWVWQRGGLLLVDRVTGHISPIGLPDFDSYYSLASWYRDYVAYCCGVSDDGKKLFAVVFQVGRRKPVLQKPLDEAGGDNMPDSEYPAPGWGPSTDAGHFRGGRRPEVHVVGTRTCGRFK